MKNNANYKASTDFHHWMRTFNVGDYVMLCLRHERFSPGNVKKLHAWNAWPFQIFKKINLTVYVVDLPSNFCGSYTLMLMIWFHVEVHLINVLNVGCRFNVEKCKVGLRISEKFRGHLLNFMGHIYICLKCHKCSKTSHIWCLYTYN